jgi:ketosteroid isomerase-like protein
MRFHRAVWILAAVCGLQFFLAGPSSHALAPATTPSATAADSSEFQPLTKWTAAVVAGDKTALAALYTTKPPSKVQTPAGKAEDPSEEPTFWSGLAAKGLSNFRPKILEVRKPQTGVVILVLRIEMTLGKNPGEPNVVSAAQVWVQQDKDVWRIAGTNRGDPTPTPPGRLPEPDKPNTELYPPIEKAGADIAAALQAAAKDHKRVILVFGGNWCFDCHVLDAAFHSKDIAPLVDANYVVVEVNVGDGKQNTDLAAKYDTPLDNGLPVLAVVDPDGKVVYSQKAGEFESSAKLGPEDITKFLDKWKPAAAK